MLKGGMGVGIKIIRRRLIDISTISKILRQREKYVNPQPKEESASPGEKSKADPVDGSPVLSNGLVSPPMSAINELTHDSSGINI